MKKNLILCLCSLIFALFILEIALLIVYPEPTLTPPGPKSDWALVPERVWTEHHPVLGWFHQKNKKAVLRLKQGETEININSIGLRGTREYSTRKPANVTRILALGDSFVFGWGVRDDQTFSALIEKDHPRLEVLNFGVPGYGVDQILMTYRTLAKSFEADYVLVHLFPEDFWRATRAFSDTGHAKPYFLLTAGGKLQLRNVPVPQPFTLRTNQFPEIVEHSAFERVLLKSLTYRLAKQGFMRLGKNLKIVDPDSSDEWRLGRAILDNLIREIRSDGAKPVLVLDPPERYIRATRQEALHKSVLRFAKKENLPILDLTPVFRQAVNAADITAYYIPDDWHWNAQGHELAAKSIIQFLQSLGLAA